jgi:hypothetical protein
VEAFQFELRAVMGMMNIPVRRHVVMVDSSQSLDTETTMLAMLESPVPLAIFEPSGSVKFANHAFVEALEGIQVPVANFNDLAITRRHRDLHGTFQQAVEGKGPLSRVVLAGAEGGERSTILWMAPLIKEGRVTGVHMTVVLSNSAT